MPRYPALEQQHPHFAHRGAENEDARVDFAFADTIVAADLDEAVPPSGVVLQSNGTVYVQDDAAMGAHCIVPLGYPTADSPPPSGGPPGAYLIQDASFYAQRQPEQHAYSEEQHMMMAPLAADDDESLWLRMRANVKASRAEMSLLWSATASLEEGRAVTVGRRLQMLFSFFEWDRADVLRAAWIGLAVFVLAATVGAIMLQSS